MKQPNQDRTKKAFGAMPELEKEIKEQVCARREWGRRALTRQNDVREGLPEGTGWTQSP